MRRPTVIALVAAGVVLGIVTGYGIRVAQESGTEEEFTPALYVRGSDDQSFDFKGTVILKKDVYDGV